MSTTSMSARLSAEATAQLGSAPVGRLIIKFAAPSVVAMLVMSLYNIVDQLFIGHGFGYLGNAATNVVFPVTVLTIALSMIIGEGATTMFSIRMGEGNREAARQNVGNGIVMLSIIGVSFAALCLMFLQPMLGFFGATEAIMPYAIDYAGPIVFGIPFVVVGPGLNAFIRANGAPGFAMKAMITGAVLNTILDPIFMFTLGMGVKGAAVATALSQFVGFAMSASYLLKGHGFNLARRHFRLKGSVVAKIVACGASPCLSQMAIMVVIILMNKTLVHYGARSIYGPEIPLAAHGITMKVNQILFSILLGISMGAQPIIGYNFGAGKYDRVKKAFFTAAGAATTVGMLGFVIFFFFPQYIVNLFGAEEALYQEFAKKCFRIFLFCIGLNGFTILSGTFFQSMARVRYAAAIQLSRQILFMVPAVLTLSHHYGVEGVLLAAPITDALSFLLALTLVLREMRRLQPANAADLRQEFTELDGVEPA